MANPNQLPEQHGPPPDGSLGEVEVYLLKEVLNPVALKYQMLGTGAMFLAEMAIEAVKEASDEPNHYN